MQNQSSLSAVWTQVEAILSNQISVIPVRDKDDPKNPKAVAKTPYTGWKKYQSEIITKQELWHQMEKNNTTAIATICGVVSGNMEVIDVDVKYFPGIDAKLFTTLQTLYPDLFARLRIHKTPSGGYHLIYRIHNHAPEGNMKLAGRPATPDELSIKPKEKVKNFIETRGEGGYVVAPPSLNYSLHTFNDIPTITWEERCSLINVCRSFNEIITVVKPKAPKTNNTIYDENPFDHFNQSPQGADALTECGWKFYKDAGEWIYFTRPGKATGVSAAYHKAKKFFYFFTSSSEFDEQKCYTPSAVISKLLHNDDFKKTYRYLVEHGFGRINPNIEQKMAKRRAVSGAPLPSNASPEANKAYQEFKTEFTQKYPYGIFWEYVDDKISISRERLYSVSQQLGFYTHNDEPCQITGHIIAKCTPRKYFDTVKAYIQEEDGDEYEDICNSFESFIQKNGAFTISRLPILDESRLIKSTKFTSYKFYNTNYIAITRDTIDIHSYDDFQHLVWEHEIIPRTFTINESYKESLYYDFLSKAIGISKELCQTIGYLAHEYKDETMGYIVTLTEKCPDPKQGGGSGKNIFSTLLSHCTTVKTLNGSQVQFNEKFMQSWNGERILSISDAPKRFDFSFLKELSTGTGIVKKLWKDEQTITPDKMPKLIVSTNYSFEAIDGGLKRRILPIEFTDFFTRTGGVDVHYDKMFPSDWTDTDWSGFDTFIAGCIQAYMACNGKVKRLPLSDGGWRKQFEQTYNQNTYQFIVEHISEWTRKQWVAIDEFNRQYERFCQENGVLIKYRITTQRMNSALEDYCTKFNISFNKSEQKTLNGVNGKYKVFLQESDKVPW